jgi:rubrerythrin
MAGLLARWILSWVVKSAMALEAEAIDAYRAIRERLLAARSCTEELESSICHLLEEEEEHKRVLGEVAAGRLSVEELEKLMARHVYPRFNAIQPLADEDRAAWEPALRAALAQEEKTWIFYSNLRRMSRIPVVKRAFEVMAGMENEHVLILRRILGEAISGSP